MADELQRRSTPVRWPRLSGRRRRQLLGLAGLGTVAVIIAGVIAAYDQVFAPGVPATVIANEAGLLMKPGASVTLYGADVGHVTSVTSDGSDARLGISIDPGEIANIPADVQASIQAPTLFGPKYLSLVVPHQPPAQSVTQPATQSTAQSTALSATPRLRAGQVIEPTAEPTEIGTVFESLVQVLSSVDPSKLSATLGAMSTALSGNGGQIGSFVSQLDSYLREFNPSLPAVTSDLTQAPSVLRTYATAAPDLVATLGNLRPASRTLVSEQAQFDAFLLDLTGFSERTSGFLRENGGALAGTLRTLAPVTGMLAYYSPEIPCLLASANEENGLGDPSLRIRMSAAIVPGKRPYTYPANLPSVSASGPPSCYGGPLTRQQAATWNLVTFNDGTGSNFFSGGASGDNLTTGSPPLAVQLFGPSAASAAGKAAATAPSTGKGR